MKLYKVCQIKFGQTEKGRDSLVVQLGYWIEVKDGDPRAKGIQSRHYSAHHYKDGRRPLKIVGPGEYMLLLTSDCSALFGWQYSTRPRKDGQQGVSCFIFRNEGPVLSSDVSRSRNTISIVRIGNLYPTTPNVIIWTGASRSLSITIPGNMIPSRVVLAKPSGLGIHSGWLSIVD